MHTQTAYGQNPVYMKTAKGREEISARRIGLNPRQRSVLIMMDGTKSFDAMSTFIPPQELGEIVSFLTQNSLIVAAQENAVAPAIQPVPTQPPQPAPAQPSRDTLIDDPALLRQIKDFMTTTSHTYLGLLGADVIQRIERARDAAQLMTVVGHWHMALRDSKQGTRFATPYLEQVKRALAGAEAAPTTLE